MGKVSVLVSLLLTISAISPIQGSLAENQLDATASTVGIGEYHSCLIDSSGEVSCWGANDFGETDVPSLNGPAVEIDTEYSRNCIVTKSGTVTCWGYNEHGLNDVPLTLGRVVHVSVGGYHTCVVLESGQVSCWGENFVGQISFPDTLENVIQLASGSKHTCALDSQGTVSCWGGNEYGQSKVPSNLDRVSKLYAGEISTCVITESDKVQCWGEVAQLIYPINSSQVSQLSVGQRHTCALDFENVVTCWGSNTHGQTRPKLVHGSILQIVSATDRTCVTSDLGEFTCWGGGLDDYGNNALPTDLGKAIQVSSGGKHSCAITADFVPKCWGLDGHGITTIPDSLGKVSKIASGDWHVCVVDDQGYVTCWGSNEYGQASVPSNLGKVLNVAVGSEHSCALTVSFVLKCWGSRGKIKLPTDTSGIESISVSGDKTCLTRTTGVIECWDTFFGLEFEGLVDNGGDIYAGPHHTCVLGATGSVTCSGNNEYSKLDVPSSLGPIDELALGENHTCALGTLGDVTCWGSNEQGQTNVPAGIGFATQISAGAFHTCAVNLLNEIFCWGSDRYGQAKPPKAAGTFLPPVKHFKIKGSPVLEGNLRVDTLVSVKFQVADQNAKQNYRWIKDGLIVPGAVEDTYRLGVEDLGSKISVQVILSGQNYLSVVKSSEPKVVIAGQFQSSPTPLVSGNSAVGQILSVRTADWDAGVEFKFKWLRNGSEIPQAVSSSYAIQAVDLGKKISVTVTGSKPGYLSETKSSAAVLAYAGVQSRTPTPKIRGVLKLNQTLTAAIGAWDSGSKQSYQWLRNGIPIFKATSLSYRLSAKDKGRRLAIRVISKRAGYADVTRTSNSLFFK